jgi:hypothetical protein
MRKLLIGCGALVGVVALCLVIGGVLVASWVRKNLPDSKELQAVHQQLEQRFGAPEAFVPPLDGVPAADRVARFVTVRETLAPQRAAAAGRLASFLQQARRERAAERPWITKAVETFGMVRGGGELAVAMAQYFGSRDRLLLEAEMGEGEYRYLYGVAHFAWLGWQPTADSTVATTVRRIDPDLVEEVEGARGRIGRLLRQQLENQQRALEAKPQRTPAEEAALVALRAELPVAGREDALPFFGRLPAAWTATLVPYRERLAAALPQQPLEIALDVMRFEPRGKRGVTIR